MPTYALGNERLSCAVCMLGCLGDLRNGVRQNPEVYREYVGLEVESGFSFQPKQWLGDIAPGLFTPELRIALQESKQRQNDTQSAILERPQQTQYVQLHLL